MNSGDKTGFDAAPRFARSGAVDPPATALYGGRSRGSCETSQSMTTFDKREDAFEKRYAHDEELRFRANARRNKRLGLWVADKLGLSETEAEAYAKSVVMADFEEAGDHDVFRKVRADLDAKGRKEITDKELRRTMDDLLAQAVEEI